MSKQNESLNPLGQMLIGDEINQVRDAYTKIVEQKLLEEEEQETRALWNRTPGRVVDERPSAKKIYVPYVIKDPDKQC